MTIQWGSYETAPSPGGTSGMRVGIEVTNTSVSTSSSSVTFTFKVYTQNYLAYTGDSQGLTFGGSAGSGSVSFSNSSATGAVVLRATRTYTYNYSSTSYGSSPGSVSFSATSYGAFDGTTASKSVTASIPARPYAAPNAPTSLTSVRNSDAQATISWTRNPTSQRPYTSLTVQMATYTGSTWSDWSTIATTSATANSYVKTGLSANRVYRFQVRANNSVGSSAFVSAGYIYMTPGAPTNVVSSIAASGSTITTTWTDTSYVEAHVTWTVERSVNGAAYASVATGIAQATTNWTDSAPGAGTNTYRVKAVQSFSSTSSAYGTGNTVTTIVPPLAPTQLSPNGVTVDFSKPVTLTWQHNPGGDGAPQSAFTIEYSTNGGTSWAAWAANVASSASTYTIPAGSYGNAGVPWIWRVRTVGVTSGGYGPNSASATITGSSAPTATITSPATTTAALPVVAAWTYAQAQGSAQSQWEANLYSAGALLESKSGSGTTSSVAFAYPVEDATAYTVSVRVMSAAGLWSTSVTKTTTISLPVPAAVNVAPEYQECTGTVILHLSGADPAPAVANRVNSFVNPSFRGTSGTAEVRRNNVLNPAMRTAVPAPAELRRNLATNPSFRAAATGNTTTIRTNWVANPNGAVDTLGWATDANGTVTQDTGTASPVRPTTLKHVSTASGSPIYYNGNTPAAPNEIWTASVYVKGTGSAQIALARQPGGAIMAQSATVTLTGAWQRISVTGTMDATTTGVYFLVYQRTAGGGTMNIGAALLEKAAGMLLYFDGATGATGGLVYSWSGTANSSTSVAKGNLATGISSLTNSVSYQLATTGGLVVSGLGQNNDNYAAVGGDAGGGLRLGMTAGATYLVTAEGYATAGDAAENATRARRIVLMYRVGAGPVVDNVSGQVPIGSTLTRVQLRVQLPAGTTEAWIRLYNGANTRDVVWTRLLVEQTMDPALPYFDGATAAANGYTYAWAGTADAAPSTASGVPVARRNLVPNPTMRGTNGSVAVRTNLSTNPRAVSGGPGFSSNSGATWSVTIGSAVPSGHPQGITTAAKFTLQAASTNILSGYNIDTLGNTTTSRGVGAWVWAPVACNALFYLDGNSAGTQKTTAVPANTWTWVTVAAPGTGNTILSLTRTSGSGAIGDAAYVTGAIAETGVVPINYFDGTVQPVSGTVPVDPITGLAISWTGTTNLSTSVLSGSALGSWVGGGPVAAHRHMGVFGPSGPSNESARLVRTGAGAISFSTGLLPAPAPGHPVTISFDSKTSSSALAGGSYLTFYDVNGTAIVDNFVAVPAGTGWTRKVFSVGAPAGSMFMAWQFYTSNGVNGDAFWIDNVLLEVTTANTTGTTMEYFDGSVPDPSDGQDYGWLGSADASDSLSRAPTAANTQSWGVGRSYRSVDASGKAWLRSTGSYYLYGYGTGTAGKFYAASFTVKGPAGAQFTTNTSDNVVGSFCTNRTVTIPDSGQIRVNLASSVAVAGPTLSAGLGVGTYGLYITDVLIEQVSRAGQVTGDYFDGASGPVRGQVASWTGTADGSASIYSAAAVTGWTNGLPGEPVWQTNEPDGQGGFFAEIRDTSISYTAAAVAGVVGDYWAARVTLMADPDFPYQGDEMVRLIIHDGTNYVTGTNADGTDAGYVPMPTVADGPVELVAYSRFPLTNTIPRLYIYPNQGQPVRFGKVIMEKVTGPGLAPGPFFDGSTNDISTFTYDWSGAADASTSVATSRAEAAVVSVAVERRVEGGDWVQLVSGLAVPNDFVDTVPLTNGLNEYRVTAASAAPSYRTMDPVSVEGTDGQQEYGKACGGLWAFLSYGPGFSSVLRVHSDLSISETAARAKSLQPYLGRKRPGMLIGTNVERKVELKGRLHYGDPKPVDDPCRYDSPPEDWTTMGEEADIVCYRDYTGRRIFGMLSEVAANEVRWKILGEVSLSVTETEYVEEYGVA